MENKLTERIEKLERRYSRLKILYVITIAVLPILLLLMYFQKSERNILEVNGLIVKDEQGKPRIVIGAPAKNVKGRNRPDELYGIAYIDENGNDRLTFGKEPDPMTPNGILPRRVQGAGILIHDKEGIERGGYGVLDDSTALLTLDWPKTGEAIALSSNNNFSAIGLFHRSSIGQYREAVTIGTIPNKSLTFLRFSDTLYKQRLLIEGSGLNNIELKKFNKEGRSIN